MLIGELQEVVVDFSARKIELEKKAATAESLEEQLTLTKQKLARAEISIEELRLDTEDMRQAFQTQLNVLATENEKLRKGS